MLTNQSVPPPSLSHQVSSNLSLFSRMEYLHNNDLDTVVLLLSQFTLFKDIPSNSVHFNRCLLNLMNCLEYKIYPHHTPLYHEGSINSKFFLILQGTVNTYTPKSPNELSNNPKRDSSIKSQQIKRVDSVRKVDLLHSASPKVLGKLLEDINHRKVQVRPNASKFKEKDNDPASTTTRIEDLSTKKTAIVHNSSQTNLVQQSELKPELTILSERNQYKKLSNLLFSEFDSKDATIVTHNKRSSISARPNTTFLPTEERELNDIQKLKDLKETVDESIAGSAANILKKFTQRSHKYLFEGQCFYKQSGEYECGTYLGNMSGKSKTIMDHTAVCITDCHVLECNYQLFVKCFGSIILEKDEKSKLFNGCLGGVAEGPELSAFMGHFVKKTYGMNELLFHEGWQSDGLYLISKGEVQLHKNVVNYSGKNTPLTKDGSLENRLAPTVMVRIGVGQFFGEDVLDEDLTRKCTAVTIGHQIEVYFIPTETLNSLKMTCKKILKHLKIQFDKKNDIRGERIRAATNANEKPQSLLDIPYYQYEPARNFDKYIRPKVCLISFDGKEDKPFGLLDEALKEDRVQRQRIKKNILKARKASKRTASYDLGHNDTSKEGPDLTMSVKILKNFFGETKVNQYKENCRKGSESNRENERRVTNPFLITQPGETDREYRAPPIVIEPHIYRKNKYPTRRYIVEMGSEGEKEASLDGLRRAISAIKFRETQISTFSNHIVRKSQKNSRVSSQEMQFRERRKSLATEENLKESIYEETKNKPQINTIKNNQQNSRINSRESSLRESFVNKRSLATDIDLKESLILEEIKEKPSKIPIDDQRLAIVKSSLLYNEISHLAVKKDALAKKEMRKSRGSRTERESSNEKEDRNVERLKAKLLKVKRLFAKHEKKRKEHLNESNVEGLIGQKICQDSLENDTIDTKIEIWESHKKKS